MVAVKLSNMVIGGRGANSAKLQNSYPVSRSAAATLMNVSERSVNDAASVRDKGSPELQAAVEQGHIAVSIAAKASKLPEADQREIAAKATAGDANAARTVTKQKARKALDRRRRRRQPADRGVAHAEGAGDIGQCLAGITAGDGFALLVRCQLSGPAHVNTGSLCPGAAFAGPGLDQFALELSQAAQDGQHQPTVRRGGIGPDIRQRFEARATLADLVQRVEQIPGRPGQPVEPRHHQYVTLA
jgi:hypothetical protein